MSRKKFDCVEMMHNGQAASEKRLTGMTEEEKIEYWRKRTEEIRARQRKPHRANAAAGKR